MIRSLAALPLVYAYSGILKKKPVQRREYTTHKFPNRMYHFFPEGKKFENLPGVYLQHGMSFLSIDDPRIQELATNLAYCGCSVLVPELPEIKALRIQEVTIDNIKNLQELLAKDIGWFDGIHFGYLSASFSAGLGLIAASRLEAPSNFKSFMGIGGYSDFLDTVPFVFSHFDTDNYAVYVLLYNMLAYVDADLGRELSEYFWEAALDNGLKRISQEAKAPQQKRKLGSRALRFLKDLESSEDFRHSLGSQILQSIPKGFAEALSPYHQLKRLPCPVSLLHGSDDPVISPQESAKLAEMLEAKGYTFVFETTSALTHGDPLPLQNQIFGIPALLSTFGSFLSWLRS